MSKRCRDCYLFETDACPCLFYAWEDNIACGHFVDENKLPNKYSEKLYKIAYQRGYEKAIEECIKAIEDSKSLFDNNTKWTMAEKSKLQNKLRELKEQKDAI